MTPVRTNLVNEGHKVYELWATYVYHGSLLFIFFKYIYLHNIFLCHLALWFKHAGPVSMQPGIISVYKTQLFFFSYSPKNTLHWSRMKPMFINLRLQIECFHLHLFRTRWENVQEYCFAAESYIFGNKWFPKLVIKTIKKNKLVILTGLK